MITGPQKHYYNHYNISLPCKITLEEDTALHLHFTTWLYHYISTLPCDCTITGPHDYITTLHCISTLPFNCITTSLQDHMTISLHYTALNHYNSASLYHSRIDKTALLTYLRTTYLYHHIASSPQHSITTRLYLYITTSLPHHRTRSPQSYTTTCSPHHLARWLPQPCPPSPSPSGWLTTSTWATGRRHAGEGLPRGDTALHCTALHYTALHYNVLHCTVLHCTVLYCTAL